METKQLYEKVGNEFKPINPSVSLDELVDKETDLTLGEILIKYNHLKVNWKGDVNSTRKEVPVKYRRNGLYITYNNGTNLITEYYVGNNNSITTETWTNDNNWKTPITEDWINANMSKLKPAKDSVGYEQLTPALRQLVNQNTNVTNYPDDEDLTSQDNLLKFKNREYNPDEFSGKGYIILRKNLKKVNGVTKNILEQSMINKENTIYEIRYDFDLNGGEITVPENCVLKFEGGMMRNGTVVFNNTLLSGSIFFDAMQFSGVIINQEIKISWFTKGMSNTKDFSKSHNENVMSAYDLASCRVSIYGKACVNFEKIPLFIKGELLITQKYTHIESENLQFFFMSTKDNEALFRLYSTIQWGGNAFFIHDAYFKYVGDGNGGAHDLVSVIFNDTWYDTAGWCYKNIMAESFTGHCFVNTSYWQEGFIENISLNGMPIISYNSDGIYIKKDGTNKKGFSNIITIRHCNTNNVPSSYQEGHIKYNYIFDFFHPMQMTLEDIVVQGRISSKYNTYNIIPLHISGTPNHIENTGNLTVEGFWVEYVDKNVENVLELDGAFICIKLTKFNILGIRTINQCRGNILIGDTNVTNLQTVLDNIDINDESNFTVEFDSALKFPLTSKEKTLTYLNNGTISKIRNRFSNFREEDTDFELTISNTIDYKKAIINDMFSKNGLGYNTIIEKLTQENNVLLISLETIDNKKHYIEKSYDKYYTKDSNVKRTILYDIIYRVTTLIDITEENKNTFVCSQFGCFTPYYATIHPFYEFPIGTKSGTSSGWIRKLNAYSWKSSGFGINLCNAKLEIAKFEMNLFSKNITNDIIIKNGEIIQNLTKFDIIKLTPDEKFNNLQTMQSRLAEVPEHSLFVTPKNIYKNCGGIVRGLLSEEVNKGTTAQRPTNVSEGFEYYDSTLKKKILWNGTAWVNLDGTALS